MTVEEPVPIRRAAIGCGVVALLVLLVMLLVRPAIFTLAPPRDDSAVVAATSSEVASAPVRTELVLARSYGLDGERSAGEGRVQVAIILAPSTFGGIVAVNGFSPMEPDCQVAIESDRLTDCAGRAWTFQGDPLDPDDEPLQRFPTRVEGGSVIVDLTRTE